MEPEKKIFKCCYPGCEVTITFQDAVCDGLYLMNLTDMGNKGWFWCCKDCADGFEDLVVEQHQGEGCEDDLRDLFRSKGVAPPKESAAKGKKGEPASPAKRANASSAKDEAKKRAQGKKKKAVPENEEASEEEPDADEESAKEPPSRRGSAKRSGDEGNDSDEGGEAEEEEEEDGEEASVKSAPKRRKKKRTNLGLGKPSTAKARARAMAKAKAPARRNACATGAGKPESDAAAKKPTKRAQGKKKSDASTGRIVSMDAAPESDDEAIAQPTAEQPPASDVGADEEVFGSTPRASDEAPSSDSEEGEESDGGGAGEEDAGAHGEAPRCIGCDDPGTWVMLPHNKDEDAANHECFGLAWCESCQETTDELLRDKEENNTAHDFAPLNTWDWALLTDLFDASKKHFYNIRRKHDNEETVKKYNDAVAFARDLHLSPASPSLSRPAKCATPEAAAKEEDPLLCAACDKSGVYVCLPEDQSEPTPLYGMTFCESCKSAMRYHPQYTEDSLLSWAPIADRQQPFFNKCREAFPRSWYFDEMARDLQKANQEVVAPVADAAVEHTQEEASPAPASSSPPKRAPDAAVQAAKRLKEAVAEDPITCVCCDKDISHDIGSFFVILPLSETQDSHPIQGVFWCHKCMQKCGDDLMEDAVAGLTFLPPCKYIYQSVRSLEEAQQRREKFPASDDFIFNLRKAADIPTVLCVGCSQRFKRGPGNFVVFEPESGAAHPASSLVWCMGCSLLGSKVMATEPTFKHLHLDHLHTMSWEEAYKRGTQVGAAWHSRLAAAMVKSGLRTSKLQKKLDAIENAPKPALDDVSKEVESINASRQLLPDAKDAALVKLVLDKVKMVSKGAQVKIITLEEQHKAAVRNHTTELQEAAAECEKANTAADKHKHAAKHNLAELVKLHQRVSELDQRLADQRGTILRLQADKEELQQARDAAEARASNCEQEVEELTNQLQSSDDNHAQLEKKYELLENRCRELIGGACNEVKSATTEKDGKISNLQKEIKNLAAENNEIKERIEQLRATRNEDNEPKAADPAVQAGPATKEAAAPTENNNLLEQIATLTKELNDAKTKAEQAEQASRNNTAGNADGQCDNCARLNDECMRLRSQCDEKQRQLELAQRELAQAGPLYADFTRRAVSNIITLGQHMTTFVEQNNALFNQSGEMMLALLKAQRESRVMDIIRKSRMDAGRDPNEPPSQLERDGAEAQLAREEAQQAGAQPDAGAQQAEAQQGIPGQLDLPPGLDFRDLGLAPNPQAAAAVMAPEQRNQNEYH